MSPHSRRVLVTTADSFHRKMSATTHNVDQHAPIVRFEHPAIGAPVECEQHGSTSDKFEPGTSSVVWPVALLLSRHLCETPDLVRGKSCVELGAGIGMVGMVASALGASNVVMTDIARAMGVLESNAARGRARSGAACSAGELKWGDESQIDAVGRGTFDVVLAADVLIAGASSLLPLCSLRMPVLFPLQPHLSFSLVGWADTHSSLVQTMQALLKPKVGIVLLGFE